MKHRTYIITLTLFILLILSITPLSAQEAMGCENGFRLIEHDLGQTCVPENPQRIVTDNLDTLGLMLTLGIEPVAHNHSFIDGLLTRNPELEEIGQQFNANSIDIGTPANPEVVLTADPDLILIENTEILEQLEVIASVVAWDVYANIEANNGEMNWYDPMMFWADVLNATEEAERQRAIIEDRLATLSELAGDTTVSIISTNYISGELLAGSPMWIYEQLASEAGLVRPQGQGVSYDEHIDKYGTNFWGVVNQETLDEIDADVLIVLTYRAIPEADEGITALFEELETNALWQTLNAVQNEQVYEVNSTQWLSFDFASVNAIIDQMFEVVVGVDPQEVSPNPFLSEETDQASTTNCEDGLRPVEDATGTIVCMPKKPERIVALSELDIDALLALGVEPIAVTNGRGQNTPPNFLIGSLQEDVVSTGTFFQPNLEVVLDQEPDLILFAGYSDPEVLEQLNAIAPVYNAATFAESWQTHIMRVGDVLNLQSEAESVISAYDTRIANLRDELGDNSGEEFIVIRWAAEGPQIMAPNTLSSSILIDLGLTPPSEIPELEDGHRHTPPLSLETLDIVDVDYAFAGTLQSVGDATEALQETLESPLFQALQVVQDERLFVIDGSIWTSVGGAIGAGIILDDIEIAILGGA